MDQLNKRTIGSVLMESVNLFISNLPPTVEAKDLKAFFENQFGEVIGSCRVNPPSDTSPNACGFVRMKYAKDAQAAIGMSSKLSLPGHEQRKMGIVKKDDRSSTFRVFGLEMDATEEELIEMFQPFGNVLSVRLSPTRGDFDNRTASIRMKSHIEVKNLIIGFAKQRRKEKASRHINLTLQYESGRGSITTTTPKKATTSEPSKAGPELKVIVQGKNITTNDQVLNGVNRVATAEVVRILKRSVETQSVQGNNLAQDRDRAIYHALMAKVTSNSTTTTTKSSNVIKTNIQPTTATTSCSASDEEKILKPVWSLSGGSGSKLSNVDWPQLKFYSVSGASAEKQSTSFHFVPTKQLCPETGAAAAAEGAAAAAEEGVSTTAEEGVSAAALTDKVDTDGKDVGEEVVDQTSTSSSSSGLGWPLGAMCPNGCLGWILREDRLAYPASFENGAWCIAANARGTIPEDLGFSQPELMISGQMMPYACNGSEEVTPLAFAAAQVAGSIPLAWQHGPHHYPTVPTAPIRTQTFSLRKHYHLPPTNP